MSPKKVEKKVEAPKVAVVKAAVAKGVVRDAPSSGVTSEKRLRGQEK